MKFKIISAAALILAASAAQAFVVEKQERGIQDGEQSASGRCMGGEPFSVLSTDGRFWIAKGPAIKNDDGEQLPFAIYPTLAHAAAKACGEAISKTPPLPIR